MNLRRSSNPKAAAKESDHVVDKAYETLPAGLPDETKKSARTGGTSSSSTDSVAPPSNRIPEVPDTTRAIGTMMEIRCPGCDGMNHIRWERLQRGKVFNCHCCSRHFAVQSDGGLVRVSQNRKGEWVEHADKFNIRDLWQDRRILSGIGAAAAVMILMFFSPMFRSVEDVSFIREDLGYPQELEPRAKMFTIAWMKGDYRTMRQLTNALQSRELFVWTMDNPMPVVSSPATLERDAKFDVAIVKANHPNARLQVRIEGVQIAQGNSRSELFQEWKQESGRWMFQPAVRSNL